jgi:hypothetical protein
MSADILRLYLSGGTSNTTPLSSLGGAASQQFAGGFSTYRATWDASSLSGVTLGEAVNVAEGLATMTYSPESGLLDITYSNMVWAAAFIGGDGVYTLQGNFGSFLTVSIVSASLPGSYTSRGVQIAKSANNLFDDINASQRLAGRIEYRCAYIKNQFTVDSGKVRVELTQPTIGYAEIASEVITTPTHNGTMTSTELQNKHLRNWRFEAPWLRTLQASAKWQFAIDPILMSDMTNEEGAVIPQDSNGTTEGISRVIVDELDSTNKLMPLSFGTVIEWDNIKAGKYVSFWVKRYIPPTAGGDVVHDNIGLKITQIR